VLLGRERELEEIDRLLTDARAGDGGAMLIVGEAGIGKTALLTAARARFGDARVIEAGGIEAEASLPYAALGEIAGPLLGSGFALPQPQSDAIRAALSLGPTPMAGERFATCAALLGLLASAAEREPVLVIVDDAHWLDPASRECLGYAARRLSGRRVALLAASRPGGRDLFVGTDAVLRLELSRLSSGDARRLLQESAPGAAPDALDSLLETAAGNPLALLELPARLSEDQRRGHSPVENVPVGGALLDAFQGRLAELPPRSRDGVLVASAAMDRELAPVVAACGDLGIDTAALEDAETAGVFRLTETQVLFSHPLFKAVAHGQASPAKRRRVHRALAQHSEPDSRAWHLAAAAIGPDAEAASRLEEAAGRATARGAHGVAADALQRAAQLSDDPDAQSRRLYAAALAAATGGAYERCAALLEPVTEIEDPRVRAQVRHMLALVTMTGGIGDVMDCSVLLSEEAERILPIDPGLAAAMYADAGLMAGVADRIELILPSAERAIAALPEGAPAMVRCQVQSLLGMGLALAGRTGAAREALDRAGAVLDGPWELSPATQSSAFGLLARVSTGQEMLLLEEIGVMTRAARETGTLGLLPYLLSVAADARQRVGDWDGAARAAAEAIEIAEEHEQLGLLPFGLVISGRLRAARGERSQAREEIERGMALAEGVEMGVILVWAHAALGFLALGDGNTEEAIAELEWVRESHRSTGTEDPTIVPWAPDLVEALTQAGRRDEAESASAQLDAQAEATGVALPRALAARCRGLIAEADFEREFESALELHAEASAPFERGRTLLAYGSRLHRARRRVDGRERLREALEVFEGLGATPWAKRTEAELTAAGAIHRDPIADPDELSPQEIRVAVAVAAGATNREVAAKLYLSPKTIEFHLGRVYRKLGIHSRTELATLVAKGKLVS
jgi:DNA-binding CsgD family transcriptional regulator